MTRMSVFTPFAWEDRSEPFSISSFMVRFLGVNRVVSMSATVTLLFGRLGCGIELEDEGIAVCIMVQRIPIGHTQLEDAAFWLLCRAGFPAGNFNKFPCLHRSEVIVFWPACKKRSSESDRSLE